MWRTLPQRPAARVRWFARVCLPLALCFVAEAALAAPVFTTIPVTSVNEGSTYSYSIRTADPQKGQRLVTAPVLPGWLRLTKVTLKDGRAVLTGTATHAQVGTHAVTLEVLNLSTFQSARQTFTITVKGPNSPPVITGQTPDPVPLAEGASLTVQFTHLLVTDADDPYPTGFSLTVQNGANYQRSGNTITPAAGFTGTLSVPVLVNDGDADSNTFDLQVAVLDTNHAPEIVAPVPSQLATENQPFELRDANGQATTLAAFFRDPDSGDVLTYEVSGLPSSGNLQANAATGAITGTPLATDTRDTPYVVSVTANDGKAPRSALPTQTFDLTIAAFDRADVALRVAVTPAPSLTDSDIEWRFTVANGGPQPSGVVDLTAEFVGNPLELTGPSCVVTAAADHQSLHCTIADIAAGAAAVVTVTARAAQDGDVSVTAQASADAAVRDPNTGNNSAAATLNVAKILSDGPVRSLPKGVDGAVGDVDGDGFADLVLAHGAGQNLEIYRNVVDPANPAKRALATAPVVLGDTGQVTKVALADVDADGALDLVTANDSGIGNAVYLNDASGSFALLTAFAGELTNAIAASDLDGDGFVDLVFANNGGNSVRLNAGGSLFVSKSSLGNDDSRGVVAVDLDLDSLPDLVFANANGPSRFYRNLGGGNFAAGVVVDSLGAVSVASGDFNGDGRPDLVFARASATTAAPTNPVYQNNAGTGGEPVFALIGGLGASPTVSVLAADVDGNGAIDVITLNSTGTHQVYLGDGAGSFALHPVQFSLGGARGAALGNLSVDARPDLVIAGQSTSGVFFNDGRGAFGGGDASPPVVALVGDSPLNVFLGDAYRELGATATDDVDGDLTAEIAVQGTVNTGVIGVYEVTYHVADSSGNEARAVRTVRVEPREGTGGGGGATDSWLLLLLLCALGALVRQRLWA